MNSAEHWLMMALLVSAAGIASVCLVCTMCKVRRLQAHVKALETKARLNEHERHQLQVKVIDLEGFKHRIARSVRGWD